MKKIILTLLITTVVLSYCIKLKKTSEAMDIKILAINSFAIIPYELQNRFLGSGIADNTITKLSEIKGLHIIERSRMERAKKRLAIGENETITEENAFRLGEMLNADVIIIGSVQSSRDKLKISTKTINLVTKETKLFTSDPLYINQGMEGIEKDIKPINDIQDKLAMNIADYLGVNLNKENTEIITKDYTESGSAFINYAKGRDFYIKYTAEDNDRSIEFFQKAIEADPNYALAYAGLGAAYGQKVGPFKSKDKSYFEKSIEACKKAIELDPKLPEGYKSLGIAYTYRGIMEKKDDDLEEAMKHFKKALEFNPYYIEPYINMGRIYLFREELDKALENCRKAIELDYGYSPGHIYMGITYIKMKDYNKALEEFQKAIDIEKEMNNPGSTFSLIACVTMGMCYDEMNKPEKAMEYYEKALKLNPHYPVTHFAMGYYYVKQGDNKKATEEFNIYLKLAPEGEYADKAREIMDKINK